MSKKSRDTCGTVKHNNIMWKVSRATNQKQGVSYIKIKLKNRTIMFCTVIVLLTFLFDIFNALFFPQLTF